MATPTSGSTVFPGSSSGKRFAMVPWVGEGSDMLCFSSDWLITNFPERIPSSSSTCCPSDTFHPSKTHFALVLATVWRSEDNQNLPGLERPLGN